MKGIIVVDIPETCAECKVSGKHYSGGEVFVDCPFLDYCVGEGQKQIEENGCPIKPMPEKMKTSRGMMNRLKDEIRGYNFCIDKILKGNKENEKD